MSDDLSTFQYDLLAATKRLEPVHGLGIKNHLTTEHGYETVNHGRLYPNLDSLVDAGLLEKAERDGRTNEYTLTEAGRERLRERAAVLGGDSGMSDDVQATVKEVDDALQEALQHANRYVKGDKVRSSALMAFDRVEVAREALDEIDDRDFNNEANTNE